MYGRYIVKVKNKKKGGLKVEIESKDCWSLDLTLAQIIHPALKRLKKEKQGAPSNMPSFLAVEDVPFEERYENHELTPAMQELNKQGFKEWDDALDKMILAFKLILKREKLMRAKDDFASYNASQPLIDEGLALFATYYQGLWD